MENKDISMEESAIEEPVIEGQAISEKKDESQVADEHRLDRIYHVVKESANPDDLILSMTVMENPPKGGD